MGIAKVPERPVQPENAELPIFFIAVPRTRYVIPVSPANALTSIVVTEFGIKTVPLRLVHELNALVPMYTTPLPITNDEMAVSVNAELDMYVTVEGMTSEPDKYAH